MHSNAFEAGLCPDQSRRSSTAQAPSREADAFLARGEGRREAKRLGNREREGERRNGERKWG